MFTLDADDTAAPATPVGRQPLHQSRTIVCIRCAIWGSSSSSISGSASDCNRDRSAISRFKSHILCLDSRTGSLAHQEVTAA